MKENKTNFTVSIMYLVMCVVLGVALVGFVVAQVQFHNRPSYISLTSDLTFTDATHFKVEVDTTTVNIMKIVYKSREAKIDEVSALKIAICESRLDENAKNKTSSAKGLYQFTNKTWKHYCTGDVLDAEDNIDCFMKLYPKHPTWWECRG